jgi:hypothetical protein
MLDAGRLMRDAERWMLDAGSGVAGVSDCDFPEPLWIRLTCGEYLLP